jgi:CRISPR/Cas system-associated exonuclease Cas4 (RecB family)
MPEFPVGQFLAMQEQELASRCKTHQAMSNNVSAIGHPCVRYLVYKRTRGDEGEPIAPDLQALFDEGILQEAVTIRKIQDLGFKYERGQESFGIPDLQIRGKMEGVVIQTAGGKIVGRWAAEIKKVNEYAWDKINHWKDLYDSIWHYRWLVQVQLAIYHVASKTGFDDTGVLFLKNTAKNLVKPIAIPMSNDILDETFRKAKQINEHLAAKTVPERCEYTLGICQGCEFRRICQPDEPFLAGQNIQDPEFIAKLQRREELEKGSKEFKKLDTEIKDILRGKPFAVAGPFRISGKERGNGWTTTIERVISDKDVETISTVIGKGPVEKMVAPLKSKPVKKPEADPDEQANVERMDFQLFLRKIRESTTLSELNGVRKEFQEAHAKEPFTGEDLDEIRRVFKEQYVKKGMK